MCSNDCNKTGLALCFFRPEKACGSLQYPGFVATKAAHRSNQGRGEVSFVEYEDDYSSGVVLRSLTRLWQASRDKDLPAAVAPMLDATVEETEALLHEMLREKESGEAKPGQMSLDAPG